MDLEELGRALSEAATAASNHKKQNGNRDSCTVGRSSTLKSSLQDDDSDAKGGSVFPAMLVCLSSIQLIMSQHLFLMVMQWSLAFIYTRKKRHQRMLRLFP